MRFPPKCSAANAQPHISCDLIFGHIPFEFRLGIVVGRSLAISLSMSNETFLKMNRENRMFRKVMCYDHLLLLFLFTTSPSSSANAAGGASKLSPFSLRLFEHPA